MLLLPLILPALLASPPGSGLARQQALRALPALAQVSPGLEVSWNGDQPGAAVLTGLALPVPGASAEARAWSFVHTWHRALAVSPTELRELGRGRSRDRTVVRFGQVWQGLPVLDRSLAVTVSADGLVDRVRSDLRPVGRVIRGRLTSAMARRQAAAIAGKGWLVAAQAPVHEGLLVEPWGSTHVLCVFAASPALAARRLCLDAASGALVSDRRERGLAAVGRRP